MSSYVTKIEGAPISGEKLSALARIFLEVGKPFRFTARGYSMLPFIRDGDTVTLAPFDSIPETGQVIALSDPATRRLVVHRLVAKTPEGFVVKGDNSNVADGVFTRAHLLGRVVLIERAGHVVGGGMGAERTLVAFLSRQRIYTLLRSAGLIPRQLMSWLLQCIQAISLYRSFMRHFVQHWWHPPIVIKEASNDELAEILKWINPGVWKPVPPRGPNVSRYSAKISGRLAGYVELLSQRHKQDLHLNCWVVSTHVRFRYRGWGLGEILVRHVMEQAQREGAQELLLVVNEEDTPAVRLYTKLGFARIGYPAAAAEALFNGPSHQRLVMRCDLPPFQALQSADSG